MTSIQYFRYSNVITDMDTSLLELRAMTDRNKRLSETIASERHRLFEFIRRRIGEPADAEDIVQDVFYELVEAYRLPEPIEQVGAWLFRVARNRIIDRFRRKKPEHSLSELAKNVDEDSLERLESLLPAPDASPEAAYARNALMEELYAALEDLPEDQRAVFIAHEIEGRSFKDLAAESGIGINTLLSRKRYAVLYLRQRLVAMRDSLTTT